MEIKGHSNLRESKVKRMRKGREVRIKKKNLI